VPFFVLRQLREQRKEEFASGTSVTFEIWIDNDFQRALQWALYDLNAQTWDAFTEANRGQYGERAFIRVGSFINRVGYLVKRHLLGAYESILLDNLASSAIEVSIKIEPLVLDARQTVNAKLFQDFQEMIPEATGTMCPGEPSVPGGGKKRQGLS
jgi:hypothetical protein